MSTAMRQWICSRASPERVGRDRGLEGGCIRIPRQGGLTGDPVGQTVCMGNELRWVTQRTRVDVMNWDQRVDGEGEREESNN